MENSDIIFSCVPDAHAVKEVSLLQIMFIKFIATLYVVSQFSLIYLKVKILNFMIFGEAYRLMWSLLGLV